MQINTKFELGDGVKLLPLGGTGKILAIRFYSIETEYQVRYFNNGDEKTVFFYESELQKLNGENPNGA